MVKANISLPVIALATLLLAGCIDITEKISLNKDGSGTYTLSFDMGELLSDPMMSGLVLSALQGEDGLFAEGEAIELDTTVLFEDMPVPPEDIDPTIWQRVNMTMRISEKESLLRTTIHIPFSDVKEIEYVMNTMSQSGTDVSALSEGGFMDPSTMRFALNKKSLSRENTGNDSQPAMSEEDLAMLEMFLVDASYKVIYEMPGKVKSADFADAKIDGNTASMEYSLLDIFKGNVSLNGELQFK